jgi:glycosyltransferase involved in cell wall biosynthesis
MNVLFHCWEYPPRGSGIGRSIAHMAAALRAAGHTTIVVTSSGDGLPAREQTDGGFIYRAYDCAEIGSARVSDFVLETARRHDVDLIEAVDHLGESAPVLAAAARPPVMVKAHYNDAIPALRNAQAVYPWQRVTIGIATWRARRRIARERFSLERADLLAVPARRLLEEIRRAGLCRATPAGILPNPIPPLAVWRQAEAPVPTVLLVGRIDIGKGVQYLPGILRELVRDLPGIRLEIAGDDSRARWLGSIREWLRRQLGPLAANVRFLGPLGTSDLDEAYRRAWVVIAPSRWDTFPTVVLEAMVRGKAIVASPNGGMPEMLEGTACAVADPASPGFPNAVRGLLSDPRLRQRAGETARLKAQRDYSPDVVARTYVELVQSMR